MWGIGLILMRKGILDIDAYNTGHWKTLGAFTEGL
jgi:hypothetical protein